ncbi:hypothetical protein SAMN04487911_10552 [Arenibacter nanhaiticus]|uniref:Uncharacterized protein n=1 Tax=Arenibacter nanhaiticus TaxID=558155 RepID=A0A1M6DL37_9FLAO|nr:hypothetical protein [Arenibacter nanhaiticus]SHI73871.1 hypothetical protein SAMN04487911_10552 [Arenibacter nanhaiticus]
MRNLLLLVTALILGTAPTFAASLEDKAAVSDAYRYQNSFIFIESGITFSVYPDGEFDFYIDDRVGGINANVNIGRANITFNSGYNYDPYVQYDDYGAILQIENVPIYYDYYGRVSQIGNVDIRYRNSRVSRVGGLRVYYDHRGYFSHHRGYINVYNRHYVYRPFHDYFARPAVGFHMVYHRPYRRYYEPVRYSYYRPYHYNPRRAHVHVGKHYKYHPKKHKRDKVYRNDKRVAVRDHGYRTAPASRSNRTVQQYNDRNHYRNSSSRSNAVQVNHDRNKDSKNRDSYKNNNGHRNYRGAADRSTTHRSVTKKEVTTTKSKSTNPRYQDRNNNSSTSRSARVTTRTSSKKEASSQPHRHVTRNTSATKNRHEKTRKESPSERSKSTVRTASRRSSDRESSGRVRSNVSGSNTSRTGNIRGN